MKVFTIEETRKDEFFNLTKDGKFYRKSCHICGREFFDTSRNSKYCSDECAEKALVKVNKRNKTRRIRRKAYDENREINRALSKAYALAHDVAKLYKIPKICACKEFGFIDHICKGPLQLHHKNLNPFDNSPGNLIWVCNSVHKSIHDKLGDVNMVDLYNKSLDEAGFEEDEEKYKVMISYTERIIGEAIDK